MNIFSYWPTEKGGFEAEIACLNETWEYYCDHTVQTHNEHLGEQLNIIVYKLIEADTTGGEGTQQNCISI